MKRYSYNRIMALRFDSQAAGLLPANLDPGLLRLVGFDLINYPAHVAAGHA